MFELIKDRVSGLVERERRKVYEASFAFQADHAPQYQEWMTIIREIPQRDEVKIFLESESEERRSGVQLDSPLLFSPRPQSIEWCRLCLVCAFPPQFIKPTHSLTDAPRGFLLGDSRPCQVGNQY